MMQAARKIITESFVAMPPDTIGGSGPSNPDAFQRSMEKSAVEREMIRNGDALSALAGLLEGSEAVSNGALELDELSGLVAVLADAVRRTTERATALM